VTGQQVPGIHRRLIRFRRGDMPGDQGPGTAT
jgi:hypothetical protein